MDAMTLTEFLLARIAEDEAVAWRAADTGPDLGNRLAVDEIEGHVSGIHIDPDRVLAECEAKRRIMEEHSDVDPCDAHDGATFETVDCDTLKFLAAIYADHPDYRQEWKP